MSNCEIASHNIAGGNIYGYADIYVGVNGYIECFETRLNHKSLSVNRQNKCGYEFSLTNKSKGG